MKENIDELASHRESDSSDPLPVWLPLPPAPGIPSKSASMEVHPLTNIFPPMSVDEYAELKADIAANGLREAIWTWRGKIVDGRNRHRACQELGISARFREWDGKGEILAFVVSLNLRRRHLSESQRAEIADRIRNLKKGDNRFTIDPAIAVTREQASKLLSVSTDSIERAAKVHQAGTPALQDAVRTGKASVSAAAAIAHASPEEQDQIVARGKKEIIAKAKEIKRRMKEQKRESRRAELSNKAQSFDRVTTGGTVTIHCGDARDLLNFVEPSSVELVITSPPYNVGVQYDGYSDDLREDDYHSLLLSVFTACHAALVEGGRIAVVTPFGVGRSPWKPVAPAIWQLLIGAGFTLRGPCWWNKSTAANRTSWGSYRSFSSPHFRDNCECIMVAHKGEGILLAPDGTLLQDATGTYAAFLKDGDYFRKLAQDIWSIPPETQLLDLHPAPFPVQLAEQLIHFYAYPGAHILDPFAGSGSTGVAAQRIGCHATLIEISPAYSALSASRLEAK